jgi:hypothetical protein
MGNIVKAKPELNLPAAVSEEFAADIQNLAKRLNTSGGDAIRINKNKTFALPGSAEDLPILTAVVVDWISLYEYYKGKFDPKNISAPVCFARGTEPDEMAPYDAVPERQSDMCKPCPQNQWGSDGTGKACKNQLMLALLAPDNQGEGEIMLLKVSPTAIKYFEKYVAKLGAKKLHVAQVLTKISFDPNVDYASLRFEPLDTNPDTAAAAERRKEARQVLLTEKRVSQ